jgi:hypothetical protein
MYLLMPFLLWRLLGSSGENAKHCRRQNPSLQFSADVALMLTASHGLVIWASESFMLKQRMRVCKWTILF